jgi:hypothetical protein
MTPKEKAKELLNVMTFSCRECDNAKLAALRAVDEMIAELAYIRNYDEEIDEKMIIKIDQRQDFLIEVEKEIKAL